MTSEEARDGVDETQIELIDEPSEIRLAAEPGAGRIDAYLANRLPTFTRTHVQKLLHDGRVLVNGAPVRASAKPRPGDEILINLPPLQPTDILPESIPLDVLFEDAHLLVLNKPKGLTVHPTPAHPGGTLVNALLHHCGDSLSGICGVMRPGIVHRLDKETSGVMVVAKNDIAHEGLSLQFRERRADKRYLAVVHGFLSPPSGKVKTLIGRSPRDRKRMAVVQTNGKEAITEYETVERFAHFTLLDVHILTGRTHQIRVHLQHLRHPVAGDPVYGGQHFKAGDLTTENRARALVALSRLSGQALHARRLSFIHPATEKPMSFEAPPPAEIQEFLAFLRAGGELRAI